MIRVGFTLQVQVGFVVDENGSHIRIYRQLVLKLM